MRTGWNKKTTEQFVEEATKKHLGFYSYENSVYERGDKKIEITCPLHGSFYQMPQDHLKGIGCKLCGFEKIKKKRGPRYSTDVFIEKAVQIHGDLYSYEKVIYVGSTDYVTIICPTHGDFQQIASYHLAGNGCTQCNYERNADTLDDFCIKASKTHKDKYDYSLVQYVNSYTPVNILCPVHGIFSQVPGDHIGGHGCSKCGSTSSVLEERVEQFLIENQVEFQSRNRSLIKPLEIDFVLPNYHLGIECHGLYWHSDLFKPDNFHLEKLVKTQEVQHSLVQFFEDELLFKFDIISSVLLNKLGKCPTKIFARKCTIQEITYELYCEFLNHNHLQGVDSTACIRLGLYYEDELISVMGFSKLRKILGRKHQENAYELSRFATKLNCQVLGGASKLLRFFERNYSPQFLISYADRRYSLGNLYQQLGFEFSHYSKPNYFYVKKSTYKRLHRFNFRKSMLKNVLKNFDETLSERENMKAHNYYRVYDCGTSVWIKIYGDSI